MGRQTLAVRMAGVFLHGALCHAPLRAVVLGRETQAEAATLAGHIVQAVAGGDRPVLRAAPGDTGRGEPAAGVFLQGLSDTDLARIGFYLHGAGVLAGPVQVRLAVSGAEVSGQAFLADAGQGDPWVLPAWQRQFGAIAVGTARAVMAAFGTAQAADALKRRGMLEIRAASRLRAEQSGAAGGKPAPDAALAQVRHAMQGGDVVVHALHQPYARFFAVEEYDLRHRRFDGAMSRVLNRAVFVSGDAAVVLPYDPVRDRVLVIEQFRPGPYARGDGQPWQLEPIAGRIDAGETPEEAARREAVEEAGIVLRDLIPIAHYYPSPGAKTEFLYTFLALADLPDTAAGIAGLDDEGEDIRVHLLAFQALMALVASGEVATGPLILSAHWLAARRDGFMRAARSGG